MACLTEVEIEVVGANGRRNVLFLVGEAGNGGNDDEVVAPYALANRPVNEADASKGTCKASRGAHRTWGMLGTWHGLVPPQRRDQKQQEGENSRIHLMQERWFPVERPQTQTRYFERCRLLHFDQKMGAERSKAALKPHR